MTESKDQIVIANEFAHVTIARLSCAEGDRILVAAPKRERVAQLDALTLWTLAGQPHEVFSAIIAEAPIGFAEH